MSVSRRELLQLRRDYFDRNSKETEDVYPGIRFGPRYMKDKKGVFVNWKALSDKCAECMVRKKSTPVCVSVEDLCEQLADEVRDGSVAIHLLPTTTFGLVSSIYSGTKGCDQREQLTAKIAATQVVSYLRQLSDEEDAIWINVYSEKILGTVLQREASMSPLSLHDHNSRCSLPDPLAKVGVQDEWTTSLRLKVHDKSTYTENVMAQYLCNGPCYQASVDAILNSFRSFTPVFISDYNRQAQVAVIIRLKSAAKYFQYGYRIRKISCNGVTSIAEMHFFDWERSIGFMRVPDDLCHQIDACLTENNGFISVTKLLKHICQLYSTTIEGALFLLREMTRRNGIQDTDVDPNHHWIIYCDMENYYRSDHNIPDTRVQFTKGNLGKFIYRSLAECEEATISTIKSRENSNKRERSNGVTTKFNRKGAAYEQFLKIAYVGFPYQCDRLDRSDNYYACGHRFVSPEKKDRHDTSYHEITASEKALLSTIQKGDDILDMNEWLEDLKRKELFKEEDLMKSKQVGNLIREIVIQNSKILNYISLAKSLLEKLKEQTNEKLQKIREAKTVHAKQQEIDKLCNEEKAIQCRVEMFERVVLQLKMKRFTGSEGPQFLTRLFRVMHKQMAVAKVYNDGSQQLKHGLLKASRVANMITEEWDREIRTAGSNYGAVGSDSYAQSLGEGGVVRDDGDYQMAILAMIAETAEHGERISDSVVESYMDRLGWDGSDCTEAPGARDDQPKSTQKEDDCNQKEDDCNREGVVSGATEGRRDGDDDKSGGGGGPSSVAIIETSGPSKFAESPSRKRRTPEDIDPYELYGIMKREERLRGNSVLDVGGFSKVLSFYKKRKCEPVMFDTRHFTLRDIGQKFVGGTRRLPGHEVVRTGSRFQGDGEVYDIVDPMTIHVVLNDFRDLVFYVLCAIREVDRASMTAVSVNTTLTAIRSALNVMYGLSQHGQICVENALNTAVSNVHLTEMSAWERKEKLWLFFLACIVFLNGNSRGNLNRWFAVRLCRHGNPTLTDLVMFDERLEYLPFEHVSTVSQQNLCQQLCSSSRAKFCRTTISGGQPRGPNYQAVLLSQADIIKQIEDKWENVKIFRTSSLPDTCQVQTPSEYMEPVDSMAAGVKGGGKKSFGLNVMARSKNKSMATSPETFVDGYEHEVNYFRGQACSICLECFSNRPLEGLNCVYLKAEASFKKKYGKSWSFDMESEPKMMESYLKEVTSQCERQTGIGQSEVEANGMHLFHRECLRRYIHISALENTAESILCPLCKTIVYSADQKQIIKANINDIACKLALSAKDHKISLLTTDNLINMKRDPQVFARYFPCHAIDDKECHQGNDDFLFATAEEVSCDDYFKMKQRQDSLDSCVAKDYIEVTKASNMNEFCLGKAIELVNGQPVTSRPIEAF